MPIASISVVRGRDAETLRRCLRAVHDALRETLDVPDAAIRVLLTEVDSGLWSAGGQTLSERAEGEVLPRNATGHRGT